MLANATVEFLIEKLRQLLLHGGHLFSGADHEVEKLDDHLLRFKASITDAPKQQSRRDRLLTEPISRIRRAVYDAEDTIDALIIEKNPVNESAPNIVVRTVEEIVAALEQIRCIYTENSRADSDDSDAEDGVTGGEIQEQLAVKEQNVIVGIEYPVERVFTVLMEESDGLQILPIIGMPGMGKTILAQKIFHDARRRKRVPHTHMGLCISRVLREGGLPSHIERVRRSE